VQLTAHDALGAHARDELGISHALRARPLQAALASAAAFAVGAGLPLGMAAVVPEQRLTLLMVPASLACLALLGALAARLGGAPMLRGALRVTVWSALAMLAAAAVGSLFGA
jgi:VIT1/CCC1 family predicted Fe2+/Mn2+ transporter